MGPPQRKRFNAKARSSVAGVSSSKGKSKARQLRENPNSLTTDFVDVNAAILEPKTSEDKDRDRKERMKQELIAASQSKMSSKKKRRLDSYINKKLKKEERLQLFEKLAQSQAELPSTLHLQSSSFLGSGRHATVASRLEKEEDKQVRRALDGTYGPGNRKRKRPREHVDSSGQSGSETDSVDDDNALSMHGHDDVDEDEIMTAEPLPIAREPWPTSTVPVASSSKSIEVGSALRRNEDGTLVAPRVVKRKPRSKRKLAWNRPNVQGNNTPPPSESSFDSSESFGESDDEETASHDEARADEAQSGGSEEDEESHGDSLSEGEDAKDEDDPPSSPKKRKLGNFKEWALKQISVIRSEGQHQELQGEVALPTTTTTSDDHPTTAGMANSTRHAFTPRDTDGISGPLGEKLDLPNTSFAQHLLSKSTPSASVPKRLVTVKRTVEVQAARLLLPVVSEEQPIMEAILLNPVVIICGETGSGKTTQVPQFLFEAGFGSLGSENPGMIGITQPRRVAAMSMASRVAHELSLPPSRVSYQIRYDATISPSTSIKFMTDGVLLRELSTDFLLSKYSVVIVDEAHERSMNTDILIGVLSRVMKLREDLWKKGEDGVKPLRLIIMSATLRITDFSDNKTLFPQRPAIITIATRQHPVTIHFNRRTSPDYVSETVRKAIKIHTRLPAGGILIFLTGQNEISAVCKKLEKKFGRKALEQRRSTKSSYPTDEKEHAKEGDDDRRRQLNPREMNLEPEEVDIGLSTSDQIPDFIEEGDIAADADGLDSDDEALSDEDDVIIQTDSDVPMHIVPLYSLLSNEKQMQVFKPPPPDARLVVVATNVAETSLTIPGIRYVIDCGRAKQRLYDNKSGIQSFQVGWISKASAAQRAGRAGRTGPGHCYRLYSSALFENHFQQFSEPEILRVPIDGVVLQMKSMHIDAVINFPFPTPPDRSALKKAEIILTRLGALDVVKGKGGTGDSVVGGHVTDLGRAMSIFPVSPRFSKMIVSGRQHGCLPYIVAIVSALSVGDPFIREDTLADDELETSGDDSIETPQYNQIRSADLVEKERRKATRRAFFKSQELHSSLGKGLSDAFRILSVVGAYEYAGGGSQFCAEHFVRPKMMDEIHRLRAQISRIVHASFPTVNSDFSPRLAPPSEAQLKVLRQLLTAGFIDQVAIRKDLVDKSSGTKYASARGVPYQALDIAEDVFIHPSSVLFHKPPPDFLVFEKVVRTSKPWIKGLTAINPSWLPTLGPSLCTVSKPRGLPSSLKGTTVVTPMFGPGWELPPIKL